MKISDLDNNVSIEIKNIGLVSEKTMEAFLTGISNLIEGCIVDNKMDDLIHCIYIITSNIFLSYNKPKKGN